MDHNRKEGRMEGRKIGRKERRKEGKEEERMEGGSRKIVIDRYITQQRWHCK